MDALINKILSTASVIILAIILTSCGRSTAEPPQELQIQAQIDSPPPQELLPPPEPAPSYELLPPPQELPYIPLPYILQPYEPVTLPPLIEPLPHWANPLVEYLSQFPPLFRNIGFREETWGSWWQSDWQDFVEVLVEHGSDEWREMENHGYGYTFIFSDPLTGERIAIDDATYLDRIAGGSGAKIAYGFGLFDLEDSGMPTLVIYWTRSPDSLYPGVIITMHRYNNGTFEFATQLSWWEGIEFYRCDNGRLFIEYISTVAHMIDLRLLHIDEIITTEAVLRTCGYSGPTGNVYNLLTDEYFARDVSLWAYFDVDSHAELLGALLGTPLTKIERMDDIQEQITNLIPRPVTPYGRQAAEDFISTMTTIFTGMIQAELYRNEERTEILGKTGRFILGWDFETNQMLYTYDVPEIYYSSFWPDYFGFFDSNGNHIEEAPWLYIARGVDWQTLMYAADFKLLDDGSGIPIIFVHFNQTFDGGYAGAYHIFMYEDGAYRRIPLRSFIDGVEYNRPWVSRIHSFFMDDYGRMIAFANSMYHGILRYDHIAITREGVKMHQVAAMSDDDWYYQGSWYTHHWYIWSDDWITIEDNWLHNNPTIYETNIGITPLEFIDDLRDEIMATLREQRS